MDTELFVNLWTKNYDNLLNLFPDFWKYSTDSKHVCEQKSRTAELNVWRDDALAKHATLMLSFHQEAKQLVFHVVVSKQHHLTDSRYCCDHNGIQEVIHDKKNTFDPKLWAKINTLFGEALEQSVKPNAIYLEIRAS